MVELKTITEDNFEECIGLKVLDSQSGYLASSAYSLSEAYALTNHPLNVPIPFAIYNKNTMVGFTLVVYQPIDANDPDDDEDTYYLPRIMIDQKYQGLGYGKQALHQIIELVKTRPTVQQLLLFYQVLLKINLHIPSIYLLVLKKWALKM